MTVFLAFSRYTVDRRYCKYISGYTVILDGLLDVFILIKLLDT